jgi:hypothetical protein
MKKLKAQLKKQPFAIIGINAKELGRNYLYAGSGIEVAKKKLLYEIKKELKRKIAVLDIDDIKFEFIK